MEEGEVEGVWVGGGEKGGGEGDKGVSNHGGASRKAALWARLGGAVSPRRFRGSRRFEERENVMQVLLSESTAYSHRSATVLCAESSLFPGGVFHRRRTVTFISDFNSLRIRLLYAAGQPASPRKRRSLIISPIDAETGHHGHSRRPEQQHLATFPSVGDSVQQDE